MAELPIACTLSPDELRATADSLLPGLIGDGGRVTVTGPEGSAPLFADLVAVGHSIAVN